MSTKNNETVNFPFIISRDVTSWVDNVETVRKALHEAIEIKYFYEGTATLLIGTNTISVQAQPRGKGHPMRSRRVWRSASVGEHYPAGDTRQCQVDNRI